MEQIERRRFPKKIFFILLLILGLGYGVYYFITHPSVSTEKAEYRDLKNAIIYEGIVYPERVKEINGELYFPFSFIKESIDPNVFYDKKGESLIITTESKVIRLHKSGAFMEVNKQREYFEIPIVDIDEDKAVKEGEEGENLYIALDHLFGEVYPFVMNHSEETGAIVIEKHGKEKTIGTLDKTIEVDYKRLRQDPSLRTPYVDTIKDDEVITIEKKEDGFYYVRKENGIAGYVKENTFSKVEKKVVQTDFKEEDYNVTALVKRPINMTWEPVYNFVNPNTEDMGDMPGLTVVSPTWFELKDGDANITNMASRNYVYWAQSKGYDIWAAFTNAFIPERTHLAIKDFENRQKLIDQLVEFSKVYKLDGINVDFENVNAEDKNNFTQFIRELVPYAHKNNLVVSVDVTFASSENLFYDRKRLAEAADFIAIMAYDEHWGTSPVAGSVASFPWVEENLQTLLKEVPNEKLILGIPTYTRVWQETTNSNGETVVTSDIYGIEGIQNWMYKHKLQKVYDESTGQNYAEFYDSTKKVKYKTWLEDLESIRKRVEIVHKEKLAGVATWQRPFTSKRAWEEIDESLNK